MHFIRAGKGESNYAQSVLWHSGEWRRHLMAGAAQAFHTRLPEVSHGRPLARALDEIETGSTRLALDNYEAGRSLSASACSPPVVLALGPERGWSADERDLFRARDFELVHLGSRVLRAETACVAAVAIVKAKLGRM